MTPNGDPKTLQPALVNGDSVEKIIRSYASDAIQLTCIILLHIKNKLCRMDNPLVKHNLYCRKAKNSSL